MELNKNSALKVEKRRTAGVILFRVSAAPTSPRRQEVITIEECRLYYAIKKGESKTRPLVCIF